MESFSDGVFAFAATLLVVDLALHPPGTALQQVVHAWPSFVAYIVSFLTIGTAWLAHTGLTDRLVRTDPLFLRLNLLLLLVVVFLPFPTRLIADARYHPPGNGCSSPCTGSRFWSSASWGLPWMRTPAVRTCTHHITTAPSPTPTGTSSCPWSSGR
jgi:Endosomal/lysosomal potassium channel TMEM175